LGTEVRNEAVKIKSGRGGGRIYGGGEEWSKGVERMEVGGCKKRGRETNATCFGQVRRGEKTGGKRKKWREDGNRARWDRVTAQVF